MDAALASDPPAAERRTRWHVPLAGRDLFAGVAAMVVMGILCWPAALSVGGGILATERRRYRTVAWVGVVVGGLGAAATVAYAVYVATSP